ncbi:MAG: TPM domain-containing protein [Bacteroidia bacterium]|nr:TPM domain-containing protein [Bacteroidia bacterium]
MMGKAASQWLSTTEEQEILNAIQDAESLCSGEIRVHLEAHCSTEDPLDRAVQVFYKLKMDRTAARNGVLLYLSVEDRKLAIIGDKGIHQYIHDQIWDSIRMKITRCIQESGLSKGICEGIHECAVLLSNHFPYLPGDNNELPNEISV